MVSSSAMEVIGERGRAVAAQLSQPFPGFYASIAAPADNRVSVASRGVMIRIRGAGSAYAGHAAIFIVGGCCHSRDSACAASKQQYGGAPWFQNLCCDRSGRTGASRGSVQHPKWYSWL